jgi:hypothetical protein
MPARFYVNALAGWTGGQVDGTIVLTTKVKDATAKQSVAQNYHTRYVARVPIKKRRSFGLHAGAASVDYSKMSEGPISGYLARSVFGGLSFLKAKHTHWKLSSNYREVQGTLITRINADGIFYFDRKHPLPTPEETIDDVSRKYGVGLYFDGKATFWSRGGRMGLNYMLGVGMNSDLNGIPLFAGIGLGYSFL